MANREEIDEWLHKANEDLLVCRVLLRSGEELALPCLFHLQQMLEKTLKALMVAKGSRVERTHDLGRLVALAGAEDVDGLFDLCETLSLFAVGARYPGDLPFVSVAEAGKRE